MKHFTRTILAITIAVCLMKPALNQNIPGSNFIQRQLLCALDRAPCDSFGQQIKGKYINLIFNIKFFVNHL